MNILDMLSRSGGVASIARDLGISTDEASAGAEALAPAILGGFQKREQGDSGGGLSELLSSLGGGGLLDQVLAPAPTDASQGNDVLGEIFGSKDVSRTVAQDAAGKSGLNPELLKKMLPLLAMVVTGLMARRSSPDGTSGGGLGDLWGDARWWRQRCYARRPRRLGRDDVRVLNRRQLGPATFRPPSWNYCSEARDRPLTAMFPPP